MRIFNHWVTLEKTIEVEGEPQKVRCFGGANESPAAARADAERRLQHVEHRVKSRERTQPDASYEADIVEEVITRLDPDNIVTRNRYGALVLNTANLMFVDIDHAPLTFCEVFFGKTKNARDKTRVAEFVKAQLARPEYAGLGLRIYQTHKGLRVIVTGRKFSPRSDESETLMRRMGCDWLYQILCQKQACYRARLSPKPHRIKCETIRVTYPRDAAGDAKVARWAQQYQDASKRFAVCRLLETVGTSQPDPIVEYHDLTTGVGLDLPLA